MAHVKMYPHVVQDCVLNKQIGFKLDVPFVEGRNLATPLVFCLSSLLVLTTHPPTIFTSEPKAYYFNFLYFHLGYKLQLFLYLIFNFTVNSALSNITRMLTSQKGYAITNPLEANTKAWNTR